MEPETKVEKVKKGKGEPSYKTPKRESSREPQGMHKIEWGDTIRIYLKQTEDKDERQKLVDQAKKLLDMYCEE